jgi:signal peptidase I
LHDIRRNDVLVFNYPYPNHGDVIEMHILKYYIKRCVTLPSDTLHIIQDGFYRVAAEFLPPGNMEYQQQIHDRTEDLFNPAVWNTFPYDSVAG